MSDGKMKRLGGKRRMKVTIVDDDNLSLQQTCAILESRGYVTLGSTDPKAALSADAYSTDLLILDLHMPGITGLEILQRKREERNPCAVPVLVLSGDQTRRAVVSAVTHGASDYALKPVSPEILDGKVRRLLRENMSREVVFKNRPSLRLFVEGTITSLQETGMNFMAPVKLTPQGRFDIRSPFLDEMGLKSGVFKKTPRQAFLTLNDLFLNEITMAGISPESLKEIRKRARK